MARYSKNADIAKGFNGSSTAYSYQNHLGNTRLTYADMDEDGIVTECEILQQNHYYPFGMNMEGSWSAQLQGSKNAYQYNGKELNEDFGLDLNDYGARWYDSAVGRWTSVDPLAEKYQPYSPYNYVLNNPLLYVDPDGRSVTSTHTDKDGNVIAVYYDGDKGVYRHEIDPGIHLDGKKATVEQARELNGISGGGEKMGETEHWDEFVSPGTGRAFTDTKIQFGKSFDPIIAKMAKKAEGMNLKQIAAESAGGGLFDIKKDYKNVGGLLNGKYATSRSAGNYLAGYNAQGGRMYGGWISFETFQKLAGALHVKESQGQLLTNKEKRNIVVLGISYGPPPAYGEVMYQYRMSKAGWDASKNNN